MNEIVLSNSDVLKGKVLKKDSVVRLCLIANSVSQNSSSIFTCLYVCMCVLKRDISFPSDSKLTQPLPRYQFKFRIRTDYFGLVIVIIIITINRTQFYRFSVFNAMHLSG